MKHPPYSLSEAEVICKDVQFLLGRQFESGSKAVIDNIVVAPFGQENKNRFLAYFLLFEDAQLALTQDYSSLLYDILIIARAKEEQELFHESLSKWMQIHEPSKCHKVEIKTLAPTPIAITA